MLLRFFALIAIYGALGSGAADAQSATKERKAEITTITGETFRIKDFVVVANGVVTRHLTLCWNGGIVKLRVKKIEKIEVLKHNRRSKCSFKGSLVRIKTIDMLDFYEFILMKEDFELFGFGRFGRWDSDISYIKEIKIIE